MLKRLFHLASDLKRVRCSLNHSHVLQVVTPPELLAENLSSKFSFLRHFSAATNTEHGKTIDSSEPADTSATNVQAEHIGYKVIGRLPNEEISIPTIEAFAVVQIGSHQFKVTSGDQIYVEKLKYADINDKLALEKVLLLGDQSKTVIGRPTIPETSVIASVEEHALDAKLIVFKKKRRKNYRRHKGHRQELTRLRILDILSPEIESNSASDS